MASFYYLRTPDFGRFLYLISKLDASKDLFLVFLTYQELVSYKAESL